MISEQNMITTATIRTAQTREVKPILLMRNDRPRRSCRSFDIDDPPRPSQGWRQRQPLVGTTDDIEFKRSNRHVSFESYLSSRWSNGCARLEQPLIPYARR